MEIKKEKNEIGEVSELDKKKWQDLEKLQDNLSAQEMTHSEADAVLSERLKDSATEKEVSIGSPETAKPYLDIANSHMIKSRAYERQANDLERKIERGIEPANKMSEVRSLRQKADKEKREADKYKQYARMELYRI